MRTSKPITGKKLLEQEKLLAKHALYHGEGTWYHYLTSFPGVLFDSEGYVVFDSKAAYDRSPYLSFGEDVHVPQGISHIPGYRLMRTKTR